MKKKKSACDETLRYINTIDKHLLKKFPYFSNSNANKMLCNLKSSVIAHTISERVENISRFIFLLALEKEIESQMKIVSVL